MRLLRQSTTAAAVTRANTVIIRTICALGVIMNPDNS
jgi:hypothetical protein